MVHIAGALVMITCLLLSAYMVISGHPVVAVWFIMFGFLVQTEDNGAVTRFSVSTFHEPRS